MAKIQIPNQFIPGFENLFNLSEDDFLKLIQELNLIPIGIGPKKFVEILVSKFESSQIISISSTIFSLGNILNTLELPIEEFASELTNSYSDIKELKLNVHDKKHLENRVLLVLKNIGSLKLTFKALSLLRENNQNLTESHIITDIRLVFQEQIENRERHAVIIHKLKLEFRKDNENKEFFLALDNNDLVKLKRQIERALEKEELIKQDYQNTISFIDISE